MGPVRCVSTPANLSTACEGSLGLAALQAANKLAIPACTVFSPGTHAAAAAGIDGGKKNLLAYQRKFHGKAQLTLVADEPLYSSLQIHGFRNLALFAAEPDSVLTLERHLLAMV